MKSPKFRLSPGVVSALTCFFGCQIASGAEPPVPPAVVETETIVLPKYGITTDRVLPPIEQWHYVSVPGFEILSSASKRNTELFVRDFCLLQQVTRILLPGIREKSTLPAYVVLCGGKKFFESFVPKEEPEKVDPVTGKFLTDGERNAMVVDFVYRDEPFDADSIYLGSDSPFRSFYLAYFRDLIRRSVNPPPPIWLEEGLVRIFSAADFTSKRIEFGRVDGEGTSINNRTAGQATMGSRNIPGGALGTRLDETPADNTDAAAYVKAGSFIAIFRNRALIPLPDFFAYSRNDPKGKRPVSYETQAYLFTHLCLYGLDQRYTKAFFKLVEEAGKGPVTEEVFQKCFGMSYRKMETEMRNYVEHTVYKSISMKARDGRDLAETPPHTLRDASDAESSRIVGEVLRLSGKKDEAVNRLIAPYVRGQYDADLLAALGIAEAEAGRVERARKFLEAAIRANTTRSRAYLELAKLRATEINTKAAAEKRSLSPEEIASMQAPLHAALKHPPAMPAVYLLLARTWLVSPTPPSKEQFAELAAGARTNCQDLGLVYRVAELGLKFGHTDTSRQFIAFGLTNSPDEATKARFSQLSAKLPPAQSEPKK